MTLHAFKEAVFLIFLHYDCLYIDAICGILYLIWNTISLHIIYGVCIHTCPEPALAYR